MASVNAMRTSNYPEGSQFSQAISREKHERVARNSLYDLFMFHDQLEKEIARFGALPGMLTPSQTEILDRMITTKEHYLAAMQGFTTLTADTQQHALVRFSDALLDLMKVMHKNRKQ